MHHKILYKFCTADFEWYPDWISILNGTDDPYPTVLAYQNLENFIG